MGTLWAVQVALCAAVSEGAAPVPVFDHVPPAQGFPFLVLGRIVVTPNDTFTERISVIETTVSVFSEYRGKKEVSEIMDRVAARVRNVPLAVDGLDGECWCRVVRTLAVKDADGVTYMGNVDLQLTLSEGA